MDVITSLHNPAIKLIRSLATKKHRREAGLFVAEGGEVLARARGLGWTPQLLVSVAPQLDWGAARRLLVSPQVMDALSGQNNPQGVLGVFAQRSLGQPIAPRDGAVWIGLDGLRDPGNMGTIIRTADAVGSVAVILIGVCCDPYSPEAVRASMGSIFAVPLARFTLRETLAMAAAWPGDIIGTAADAEADYRQNYRRPTLLLIGGESAGLAPGLRRACHRNVRIPMAPGVESLNAAIAAAVLLYEIRRHDLH